MLGRGLSVIAVASLLCSSALAQPSPSLALALRHYEHKRYVDAAALLFVVEADGKRSAAYRQRAQFWLMKCLYHLKHDVSALGQLRRIVRAAPPSRYRAASGKWLVALARRMPREMVARVARLLPRGDIEQPMLRRVRAQLEALRALPLEPRLLARRKTRALRCAETKRIRTSSLGGTSLGRALIKRLRCR